MNAIIAANGFGEMTVREEYPPRRTPWAFDNGAFKDRGKVFNAEAFEKALQKIEKDGARPDFIVVPDIVGGGAASLRFSLTWLPRLRRLAIPLYLAVQEGMEPEDVRQQLRAFDGLFVGGKPRGKNESGLEWKLATGAMWVQLAHSLGKPCHIGRVGTPKRVRWAVRIGADSIDSTQPLWSFVKMRQFIAAVRGDHGELFG